MSESTLSFAGSESFRKQLLVRNLQPYTVLGAFSPNQPSVNYETNLTVSNVIDSDNNLVSTNYFAENLYPLNEYGPEGGFGEPIGINSIASTNNPEGTNQGPYAPNDTVLDLVNEFYIEAAYVKNIWGPQAGYKDLVIITDVQLPYQYFSPYTDPNFFNFSVYTPFNIIFQNDPLGSNGLLSQDTRMMQFGASQLKGLFQDRINREIAQNTVGLINLDTITDPFSAAQLAAGKQPFFEKNWRITVPEGPLLAAVSLATRLTGTYFPASPIPGDYFEDVTDEKLPQNIGALNTVNNLTGGLIGPILNKYRNPSEVFVANTGNGQQSVLFASLNYNKYKPDYNVGIFLGLTQAVSNLFNQDNKSSGGYYVGSKTSEPSQIDSPPNQLPVDEYGQQVQTIVYGPQELGILYEGNENKFQFGLAGKSYSDDGGIAGQFVWTSPKYKPNAGWKVGIGADPKFVDQEFNVIQSDYNRYQSTDYTFKVGSILDKTQRLVESGDNVQGTTRLKHVGNAINQVSKVFNDGYKEITKGSKVIAYEDQTTGQEAGIEYCRIFTKDNPYFTYADLQKTDGIVNSGRRFTYSVFDNTYNLNIAPIKNPGSTNIIDGKVKKYMFSLENLAWRTSDRPGYTYDDLPVCEKGPNGGRIMWFPPYDLKFNDDSRPSFNETTFLGNPEPIYTYKNTSRSGSLSWTILVDNPSMMNTIIEKQLKGVAKERIDSIIDSFFAGCTKYDIYELGIKFNQIPTRDLYIYQQVLNNPRLTTEEYEAVLQSTWSNSEGLQNSSSQSGADGNVFLSGSESTIQKETPQSLQDELKKYQGFGFYFHNDLPDPKTELKVATKPFNVWYEQYIGLESSYQTKAPSKVYVTDKEFEKGGISNFFQNVVTGNFDTIKNELIPLIEKIIIDNGGKVTVNLTGSASAPNTEEYNINLSERRISSVIQWFDSQPTKDGKTLGQYRENGRFGYTFGEGDSTSTATGSLGENVPNLSIPKQQQGTTAIISEPINCEVDIKEKVDNTKVTTSTAQIYSIPAMACRRVVMPRITAEIPEPLEEKKSNQNIETTNPGGDKDVQTPTTGTTRNIKPEAEINIEARLKDGISKKILRNLFSECDYFEIIKETNPMIYDSIKEKIKYFNPAFHSMTPEGLNARLTFLNQCMRPGQTIPVIGPDGRPKYNDALNTSFGTPPILVLRVGDFYNTKIVPNNLSIQYEPLVYDMNPEGIGIQPMFAKITLGFNIIGGMGLKEPVQELQNALSFNYYANTEIYDERATATENTEKIDKYVEKQLGATPPTLGTGQAQNNQPKKGQSTIGVFTGESLDYTILFTELQTNTDLYIQGYVNYMKSIQQQSNFGILQLVNSETNYSNGKLSEYTEPKESKIYGKPVDPGALINTLSDRVVSDINKREDPIMLSLKNNTANFKNKTLREVEEKLKKVAKDQNAVLSNIVTGPINDFVSNEQNLNYTFRKMDVVTNQLDGTLIDTNNPQIYDLTGTTMFGSISSDQSIKYLYLDKEYNRLKTFNVLMNDTINKPASFNKDTSTFKGVAVNFITEPQSRFYILMSPIILDSTKRQTLITDLTSGPDVKAESDIIPAIEKVINSLVNNYKIEYDAETKIFTDLESGQAFTTIKSEKLPTIPSVVGYITPPTTDVEVKTKKIKDLYANQNLNTDKSFNGKVTFN